jgi:2-polyprenyl-6-methoxyphenol hydroxylase-like FAD-dependent oxidoreductase
VAIVGADIGCLAAALALVRRGIEVDVHEHRCMQGRALAIVAPRTQRDERIEYQPIDLEALAQRTFARAKGPL